MLKMRVFFLTLFLGISNLCFAYEGPCGSNGNPPLWTSCSGNGKGVCQWTNNGTNGSCNCHCSGYRSSVGDIVMPMATTPKPIGAVK